jgi:hypothetical protein
MRLLTAVSLIVGSVMALTMASAQAQLGNTPGISPSTTGAMNIGKSVAADEKVGRSSSSDPKEKASADKAYNAALKNLPDKQYDPWHGVR